MSRTYRHLLLLLWLPLTAAVAEPAETSALKADDSTSQEKKQDVQWTPASVTVIDSDEIEATFRRTLEDLDGYVPGLVIDATSGTPRGAAIALRGIDSDDSSYGFEPAVAVMVDGVYVGTHAGQNIHLFDFESVEVARGPQGVFTAAPAEGGAIYLERSKPTGELGLKTRLTAGEFRGTYLDAVLNFPITEQISGKFSAAYQNRDASDLKNRVADRREYQLDRTSYALSLLWQGNNGWQAHYTFDLDRDDSETPGLLALSQPADLVCVPDPANAPNTQANCASILDGRLPESGNRQRFLQNFSADREYEEDAHTLNITGEYLGFDVTSITGFRSTKNSSNQDLDGTSVDRHSTVEDIDYDQFSTELTFAGVYSDNLTYSFGGYFFRSEYDLRRTDLFVLDTLINAGRVIPSILPGQNRVVTSNQESATISGFVHANYRWDDQWNFDAGVRVAQYQKDFDHAIDALQRSVQFTIADTILEGDKEFNEVAGTAGFSYKVDELAMVYGRYNVDHTPGGFNDRAISLNSALNYDTSSTQGVELGLKSHWLDNRLRLNMAFYNNYQDDKVQFFANRFANGDIEYTYDNISDIEVRGFDLEFAFAATDNLYLRGSWGHINSDYVRFEVPDLANPGVTLDVPRDPERSPANIIYLNGQYQIPYRTGLVKIYLGYQYFDEYRSDLELAIGNVRTFSTWDASIEYQWQDYTVRLFSQNINDKRFLVNASRTFDAQYYPLDPGFTSVQGIARVADVNQPRYTGIEFVWQPQF